MDMDMDQQTPNPQVGARPFSEIPGLWLRLGNMSETFFVGELPRASAGNTFFAVLIAAILAAILSAGTVFLGGLSRGGNEDAFYVGLFACFGLLFIPVAFYLNNAIYLISAMVFGGKGTFTAQSYLMSLYFVPLMTVYWLARTLTFLPVVGPVLASVLALGLSIYQIVLTVRNLKVVHAFSTGRSLAAIFAPALLLLVPICVIAVLMLMGPAIGTVFSDINATLAAPTP